MLIDQSCPVFSKAFVLLALFLATTIQPAVVAAQVVGAQVSCPLESAITTWFLDAQDTVMVDDVFTAQAKVVNNSAYTLGGVRMGVAVYEGNAQVPSFWNVLPDDQQLLPTSVIEVPIELDIRALPAGEYNVRVYAVQGDETAVLGAMIDRGGQFGADILQISKKTIRDSVVTVSTEVNGQAFKGQALQLNSNEPVSVKVVTKNENKLPLLESNLLVVVAEGLVPLGTAVRSDKLDSVKLIPKGTRTTLLKNVLLGTGEHTIYTALLTKGVLQPIARIPIVVPGEGSKVWSYLSHIGLSEHPLQADSNIVACVGVVGGGQEERFSEELGIGLEIERGGEVVAKKVLYTTDVETSNYVSFAPGITAKDLSVTVGLLQQRSNVDFVKSAEYTEEEVMRRSMVMVDSISQAYSCIDSEYCESGRVVNEEEDTITTEVSSIQKPFWFYAGVVVAALLLMYLMLRRLSTGASRSVGSKLLSADELQ